jgi:hypothetical protein
MSFISKVLEQYDENMAKNIHLFKNVMHTKIEYSKSDTELNTIILLDKDGEELRRMKYSIIGMYDKKEKLWVWSWAVSYLKQNEIGIARSVLNYGIDLRQDDGADSDFMYEFLKPELITSRYKISDPVQLELHVAVASYISKRDIIFKFNIPDTTVYHYLFLEEL